MAAAIVLLRGRPSSSLGLFTRTFPTCSRLPSRAGLLRGIHLSAPRHNANLKPTTESAASPAPQPSETVYEKHPISDPRKVTTPEDYVYHGPLTTTFRRLKLFSLSSLTLSFALSPFIFILETTSSIPLIGRFVLAGVALGTSGVSTALVAWCGRPYVSTLRWLPADPLTVQDGTKGPRIIEFTTFTLGLHDRITRVYDTAFLVPSSRPFANWELAEMFRLTEEEVAAEKEKGILPREETVAETTDKKGNVLGRWIVHWDQNGVGTCREVGQVVRHFNVHEELLPEPIHAR
ncbi:hypothetical protein K474DRAFT_1659289 [Panus rudis PR-1116 ss-1]|nr:hypothetical protein K474DRAFT_1659289 [Panus rudis PR-1116 ss-1]